MEYKGIDLELNYKSLIIESHDSELEYRLYNNKKVLKSLKNFFKKFSSQVHYFPKTLRLPMERPQYFFVE